MAFVRIKRRRDENPAEALVLATKRLKTTEKEEKPSIFEFTATLDYSEEAVISYLDKARKLDFVKSSFKKRTKPNITEEFIKEREAAIKSNRLEVVNCFRALEDNENEKPVTVVDVVSNSSQNTENENYVYDIYQQSNSEDVDDMLMERMYSVFTIDFDGGENNEDDDSDEFFDCSDDSNDENNWRNEYPDESSASENSAVDGEEHSIGDEDMVRAMNNMGVYDLSSSDDDLEQESASEYCDSTSDYSDLSPVEYDDPVGSDQFDG